MALETLKSLDKINGFSIIRGKPEHLSWEEFDKLRNEYPIHITESLNTISFKIQDGPITVNGVNGCQVDTLIHAAKLILEGLNEAIPASHTTKAIGHLNLALAALQKRTEDRSKRGVEGTNNK